jgi:hypothetical protein
MFTQGKALHYKLYAMHLAKTLHPTVALRAGDADFEDLFGDFDKKGFGARARTVGGEIFASDAGQVGE